MSESAFYSDRTGSPVARESEEISDSAWKGLVSLLRGWIDDGSLAHFFPLRECPDGQAITGTDEQRFLDSLHAHVPRLKGSPLDASRPQDTVNALDIVDFVARNIDHPSHRETHYWNGEHTHYSFDDQLVGTSQFQNDVDLLFARNGIAFTIDSSRDGLRVRRLGPSEVRPLIADFRPSTGDPALDVMLNDAMTRFLSRNPADRQDAVEKLWDSFERLKTLELGGQKKNSSTKLIENATIGFDAFREHLEAEAKTLTTIGNQFRIRHHEHDKADLPGVAGIDYLFVRLAAFIAYLLRQTGRMSP